MKTSILLAAILLASSLPSLAADAPVAAAEKNRDLWPKLEEVVVIVKTHYDIGYTHRVKDIVQ